MKEGVKMVNVKYLPYFYTTLSQEGKRQVDLLKQEEQLLFEIKSITDQDLTTKIVNEFKSTYHGYDFMNYLGILERCKRLLLKGINDFDSIRKIIYKNLDTIL
jgi:hypothetical protein